MLRRLFIGLILALNLFLLYRLLLSDQSVFAYKELQARHEELKAQVEELTQQSRTLSKEIRLLKTDRAYIEKMIRQQTHFVKQDEILYVFPDPQRQAPAGAGPDEREN